MAFLTIENIKLKGISVCVPENIERNENYSVIPSETRGRFIKSIGVVKRHVVDKGVCTSDLCYQAAENLIKKLEWNKDDIDALVFVTQTPDYKMPSTSCILQERLKLSKSCLAFDVAQGCTGYIYGLNILGKLMSSGDIKKAILLVGNTQTVNTHYEDQSAYPLFSDAGSATALEYNEDLYDSMRFNFKTDGSGAESIIIPDGGFRNPVTSKSFEVETFEGGIKRTRLNLKMVGEDVFSFVITQVPPAIQELYQKFDIKQDDIDYFLLHQASKFTCDMLSRKMKLPKEKVPSILKEYGNASNASIPLMIINEVDNVTKETHEMLLAAFGVGLSIGICHINLNKIDVADLIFYKHEL